MAEIRVRNVDESILATFRDVARRRGHTVPEEIRRLITDAVVRPKQELIARLDRLRESIRSEHGTLDDSTQWIREERDRLG
jgi:plasmid stability protein